MSAATAVRLVPDDVRYGRRTYTVAGTEFTVAKGGFSPEGERPWVISLYGSELCKVDTLDQARDMLAVLIGDQS